MQCPSCHTDNREGRRFCAKCGGAFALVCGACSFANEPGEAFCGGCGQPLAPALPSDAPSLKAYTPRHLAERILTTRAALEGERKQVTVLFCDIVESTRLAERLDPETMHELMDRVLRLMAEAVHRYEGTVNQFLGDGLMALFGAPLALEDHALRAVQAALAIQETIAGYSEDLTRERGVEIRLRLGLNTGTVVVGKIGDDLRMDYTAVGDTTNLAARMQSLADPGTILVTEATHRLVDGYVRSEPLGPRQVKGLSEPVSVHTITGRRRRTRLEVSAERGLSPLVGRERELGVLHDCLARVREGRGQVAGIVGEPGVGKSRLVYELQRSLEGERITWLASHCVAYGKATPYLPLLEVLRTNFHIEDGDNPLQIEEKLRRGMRQLDPALEEMLPFLRELFLLPGDDTLKALDPKAKRQKTFEAIRALVVAGSQRAPLVLVHEDLHWIDRTSEDYLAFLIESLAGLRVLLLMTHRPGYSVRWADKTYYTQIALDLLDETDTEAIVKGLLRTGELPPGLPRLVHDKAEGNPLFVEEITRSLVERGLLVRQNGGMRWAKDATIEFPETAQDIIRARIDRLEEPVKRTAQTAAVIGREFGLRLLTQVSETSSLIQESLDTLKHVELIHEKRFFPELEYIFRHAIIQDVAYQSILVRRREELHAAIGHAIEALYADRLSEYYEVLAHHFSRSNDSGKAVEYLTRAGDKAAGVFANREAGALYGQVLEHLRDDDLADRAAILLKLASVASRHGDSDASLQHSESALELYERLGDRRGAFAAHMHVSMLYTGGFWDGAREDKALKHLEAAAAIAEADPDTAQKGLVYQRTGHLYLHRGQPVTTLVWARRSIELYERIKVPMGTSLGTALVYTGCIDEGVAYNEGNWDSVVKAGNPTVMAILGHELALTLALARDLARARRWGETALAEVTKATNASPIWEGFLRRPLTLIYTLAGDLAKAREAGEAVEQLEKTVRFACFFEDAAGVGFHHLRCAEFDLARAYLEEALAVFEERNNIAAVVGCTLMLGCLELETGNPRRSEEHLLRTLKVAQAGGNVLVELWALPVLGELYVTTGRPGEAAECVRRGFELLVPERNWYGLPAPMHLAKGVLTSVERRWDEAEGSFETAVDINRRYGLPWDEAKALYKWGLMCRARGGPGDRERAAEKLAAALGIFQRIGATKDVEKVLTTRG